MLRLFEKICLKKPPPLDLDTGCVTVYNFSDTYTFAKHVQTNSRVNKKYGGFGVGSRRSPKSNDGSMEDFASRVMRLHHEEKGG